MDEKNTKKNKKEVPNDEAIKNLLIINLIKDGVDPKVIEQATGIPEMTIRWKFPMKAIKKSRKDEKTEKGSDIGEKESE